MYLLLFTFKLITDKSLLCFVFKMFYGAVVSTVTGQQEGHGFDLSVWGLHVVPGSVWILSWYSSF